MNYQQIIIPALKRAIKAKKLEEKYKYYKSIEKNAARLPGFWDKLLKFYKKNKDFQNFVDNIIIIDNDQRKNKRHPLKSFFA